MHEAIKPLDNILIIKVGTTTMFRSINGRELIDTDSFEQIGRQVLRLRTRGYHVIIVSSGAVTAGMETTGTHIRPTGNESMPEVQRLAAIGWHQVLNRWDRALDGVNVGGILTTRRELNLSTPEHDEVLRTTHTLLRHGDIPIINENDCVTHAELAHQSFGQNDTLAAIFAAQMASSDFFGNNVRLILLSDIDGVYSDINDPGSVIREINDIEKYEHLAGDSAGMHGKGGMKTKFEAARIAVSAGVEMWITNGQTENAIQLTINDEIGTHFAAPKAANPEPSRYVAVTADIRNDR